MEIFTLPQRYSYTHTTSHVPLLNPLYKAWRLILRPGRKLKVARSAMNLSGNIAAAGGGSLVQTFT